ncbi:hypothetical protein ACHAWX_002980, partial [Stephanocyclus meneghinianus]
MSRKSRSATTAVGIIAAAASASHSSARTVSLTSISSTLAPSPCTSTLPCPLIEPSTQTNNPQRQVKSASFVHRVPRGGSSESTQQQHHSNHAETPTRHDLEGDVQNKRHHPKDKKKKKRSKSSSARKPSKSDEGETSSFANSHDDTPSNDDESSSAVLPPEIQHILSQSCHYAVLGVAPSASSTDILKAYRKKCVLTHPDKLPPHLPDRRSAFDKVARAYDVLGCETKRAAYDRFGTGDDGTDDVVREFFAGTSSAFFRDPARSNPFRRPPRNRDLRYNLQVTLEEVYAGTTKRVAIQQPNPMRPHFPVRKEVEVTLPPGIVSGDSVRISGVVDGIPNCAPADVVFILSERRHETFTRRGCDLAMEVKISLG